MYRLYCLRWQTILLSLLVFISFSPNWAQEHHHDHQRGVIKRDTPFPLLPVSPFRPSFLYSLQPIAFCYSPFRHFPFFPFPAVHAALACSFSPSA
jgi:hypothetical protein